MLVLFFCPTRFFLSSPPVFSPLALAHVSPSACWSRCGPPPFFLELPRRAAACHQLSCPRAPASPTCAAFVFLGSSLPFFFFFFFFLTPPGVFSVAWPPSASRFALCSLYSRCRVLPAVRFVPRMLVCLPVFLRFGRWVSVLPLGSIFAPSSVLAFPFLRPPFVLFCFARFLSAGALLFVVTQAPPTTRNKPFSFTFGAFQWMFSSNSFSCPTTFPYSFPRARVRDRIFVHFWARLIFLPSISEGAERSGCQGNPAGAFLIHIGRVASPVHLRCALLPAGCLPVL